MPTVVYIVAVLTIGTYALLRSLALLRATRNARIRGVEERRRFESVRTRTPLEDATSVARDRGIESIETHFTVVRRMVVPLIVGTTILLASVPLLADAPAATASLVGTVVAVVLGLALRPFLENAVSGIVISASRLVRIGDTVKVDGNYGTVEDITATHTTIKLWDWRRYLVPNGRMLQSPFLNYSLFDSFQWAYVEFWVAPDADLERVREIAVEASRRSSFLAGDEPPKFWVIEMDKDAVRCWVAAWANTPADAWSLTHDVRTHLLTELRKNGISLSLQRHRLSPEVELEPDREPVAAS